MNETPESKPSLKRYAPCGCVLLMLVLLILVPAVSWMVWSTASARRLEDEIAKIRAAGEPVDATDMNEFYRVPSDRRDVTRLWLQVTEAFEDPAYATHCEPLPIVGSGSDIPPPGAPWEQLAAVEALLKMYDAEMKTIHEATRQGGAARFDLKFEDGIHMVLAQTQHMRSVSRMLTLEANVRAHRGDREGLVSSLQALLITPRALEGEPLLVSQLVHNAMNSVALATLEEMLASVEFADDELKQLQETARGTDLHAGLQKAMLGERVFGLHAMRNPGQLGDLAPVGMLSTNDNAAFYLKHMAMFVEASKQPFPEALAGAEQTQQALHEEMGASGMGRIRYGLTAQILPAIQATFEATARGVGSTRTAVTAIAIERFRRRHGKLPDSLEELVPDLMPALPMDPYDGKPMRYVVTDEDVRVYTLGRNHQDDGGVLGDERLDEVFTLPLEPATSGETSEEPSE